MAAPIAAADPQPEIGTMSGPAGPRRGPDDRFGRQAAARRGHALQPERGRRAPASGAGGVDDLGPVDRQHADRDEPGIAGDLVEQHPVARARPRPAARSGAGPASAGCRGRRAPARRSPSGAPRAPPATGPSWTLTSMNPSSVIEPSCASWTIEPDVTTGLARIGRRRRSPRARGRAPRSAPPSRDPRGSRPAGRSRQPDPARRSPPPA